MEFKKQKKSTRRIILNFYGKENCFKLYNIEDSESKSNCEEAVRQLKDTGWIDFEWEKGQECHIISKVWLCTSMIDNIYSELKRMPKREYIDTILYELNAALKKTDVKWVQDCFKSWIDSIEKSKKNSQSLPEDISEIVEFLNCILFLSEVENTELLERVFSVRCFGNSKKFERVYKNKLEKVIRTFFLSEAPELTSEQILKSVGIVRYPEQLELCGGISFQFEEGNVSFEPLVSGGCISIVDAMKAQILVEGYIEKIMFIENKANYVDYIMNHKKKNELIIFHGGYYSPSKGMFYTKMKNTLTNQELYHWGDIDFGGFDMYLRLKKNIFQDLKTFRMGVEELIQYQNYCIKIDEGYIDKLKTLLQNRELKKEIECLRYMIQNKLKLEQEAMILLMELES